MIFSQVCRKELNSTLPWLLKAEMGAYRLSGHSCTGYHSVQEEFLCWLYK